jgi:uncharacterized protein (DUF433 family)
MAIEYKHLDQLEGVTVVAGHGMRVYDVFDIQRQGAAPGEIAAKHGLSLVAVYEALAYAAGHPEEMTATERQDREGYAAEMAQLRHILDSRYDEWASGVAQMITGPEVTRQLQEKSRELRARRHG